MITSLVNVRAVQSYRVLDGATIVIEHGRITEIGKDISPKGTVFEFSQDLIFPGFIDLHVHGGGGGNFVTDNDQEHLTARRFHLSKGTTSMLPTISTTEFNRLEAILSAHVKSAGSNAGSRVLGVHLEGPFLSAEKPGAHPIHLLRKGSRADMARLIKVSKGLVKMVTVAPEIEGGMDLIDFLVSNQICASVGHTAADYATATEAFKRGARSATHTFNAMSSLEHRNPGTVGAVLDNKDSYAEAILDGIHIDPVAFRILLACKSPELINLVTDATAFAGRDDGSLFKLDGREIVKKGNRIVIKDSGILAGSSLDLNQALKNARTFSGLGLPELSRIISLNAAKIIGKASELGSIDVGKIADLVVMDSDLGVTRVMLEGVWQ
jgi:N-acetylglucosamine-6-phosphate deacetylase